MMTHSDATIMNEKLERIAATLESLLDRYLHYHPFYEEEPTQDPRPSRPRSFPPKGGWID